MPPPKFNAAPDPQRHRPATAVTPVAMKAAEEHWHELRDAGDPGAAAAEEEFQNLARAQTTELQRRLEQQMLSRLF